MYYAIRPNILFRQYKDFGYLTDNSLFGYRVEGDERFFPGERFVSDSGAIMLGLLSKAPESLKVIVDRLSSNFVGVTRDELEQDTREFFDGLYESGFLARGDTEADCCTSEIRLLPNTDAEIEGSSNAKDDCLRAVLNPQILLKSLHIELATECNERCVHCYIPHHYKLETIDTPLLYGLLDDARRLNAINVTLSGGEPLLHRDFNNILAKCRELDLSVNVLSNLTLLNDDIVNEMSHTPMISVQTSIYSMIPEVHDLITGVKGSLKKTLDGLRRLKRAGIPVQISCPVMQENKDSFESVIDFGDKSGIRVATDFVIFASCDHTCSNLKSRLSLNDIGHAFDHIATEAYVHGIREEAEQKERLSEEVPICSICRYSICVAVNGDVYPCVGWRSRVLGNVAKQKIGEIWNRSPDVDVLRAVKRRDFPKCVNCPDRGYCTICMMSNSNERQDKDAFAIGRFHCQVASLMHERVDSYVRKYCN